MVLAFLVIHKKLGEDVVVMAVSRTTTTTTHIPMFIMVSEIIITMAVDGCKASNKKAKCQKKREKSRLHNTARMLSFWEAPAKSERMAVWPPKYI